MLTITNHTDGRSSSSEADFATVLNVFAPCGWVFAPWTDAAPRTNSPLRFRWRHTGIGTVGMTADSEGRCISRSR
jgi:hypothetical protein